MNRVAGTTDAKRAWLNLRGPYLLAYVAYLSFSILAPPGPVEHGGLWWSWAATILSMVLISGSIASWMVVSHVEPRALWWRLAALEVTALRVIAVIEGAFVLWGFTRETFPGYAIAFHLFVTFIMAGILSNLTWHKGKTNAPRGE